ncbi:hypothetical protein VNI00_003813 [Paramarasmius palmivorus]|uniref:Uncharacterized protein n=1 Tax=Paramarasmius palmivorus TaxID=297713 RepID=A0AAW0DN71_9AGAR
MRPVFMKNRGQPRASTPLPPSSPLSPEARSPPQTSGECANPSHFSFGKYWWRRSPSPTLSVASSDSDQSLISTLWDKIYKGRVLVGDSDGWRYEWRDEVHDEIHDQSVNPNSTEAGDDLEVANENPTTGKSQSDGKQSSRRLDPINGHVFYGSPSVSTPATIEARTPPARVNREPAQGGNPVLTSIRPISRSSIQNGSPKRRRLTTASADRRRLLDKERKARKRARDPEAMKAKQAVYAANYRVKNREVLQVKARDYRRKQAPTGLLTRASG